jgi:putative intracellular protease/amidase
MSRILFVLTSHATLGNSGRATGVWLEELATPYYALRDAGHDITLASIAGGAVPVDPGSNKAGERPASAERFLADEAASKALANTPRIDTLRWRDFEAVFLPGGHGTMWDLPGSAALARLLGDAFDAGRVVAAVCHGPAGLVNARRADGTPIVAGKQVASFTDAEEAAVGLTDVVPFLLGSRLASLGATLSTAPNFQAHAVRDGTLVTGQNPASSEAVARLVMQALADTHAPQTAPAP